MNRVSKFIKITCAGALFAIPISLFTLAPKTAALEESDFLPALSVSPMVESVILNPGDTYSSSIRVTYPQSATNSTHYRISIQPFYVDENYNNVYEDFGDYNMIVDWVSFDSPEMAEVAPGETKEIYYTFNIPLDAPAGGQYFAITVASDESEAEVEGNTINVKELLSISHLVFAEITGNTIRQGDIIDANVPSFLLSGNIFGSATIKNTGNVHGNATYKLQIYPLFSSEEIYTNEENPETRRIMPERTYYNETIWDQTPDIGIFNVIYTVEFEGVTTQVSKMVIKCPIWLLFIILFIIAALIIWIVMRVRHHKNPSKKKTTTPVSTE